MVSIVIPTLSYQNFSDADEDSHLKHSLETYVTRLMKYQQVNEVIVVVNDREVPPITGQASANSQVPSALRTIYTGKNLGFTGACNAGAKTAMGELLLFLNDDCEMSEEAMRKMVEFLEKNEDVVATQPIVRRKILNSKFETLSDAEKGSLHPHSARSQENMTQNNTIENIGFWVDTKIGRAYPVTETLNSPVPIASGKFEIRKKQDNSVYGLSGTCLLIRKDIFMKVGMWDESFHSYLEDVDLAIRLHKAGYKVSPCLDAEVTHEHMATSSKMGLYKEKQDVKNWWRLILKHPDLFVRPDHIFPLLLERARNINGLFKKIFLHVIQ